MAQSNYNIPNESAPAVRAQLNAVFQSIATNNSGSSAPTTTFAHQWWYDSTTNILKQRNAADSAWIDIGTFDQSGGTFVASVTQLSQNQVEDDTSTVFGTVSGQRLAQAVAANAPSLKNPFETLEPGSAIRSRLDDSSSRDGGFTTRHSWNFLQFGTVRVTAEHRARGGTDNDVGGSPPVPFPISGTSTLRFTRTRNGDTTVIESWSITSPGTGTSSVSDWIGRAENIDVLPGDVIEIQHRSDSNGNLTSTTSEIRNCRFRTSGQNLWPGVAARLEGNSP